MHTLRYHLFPYTTLFRSNGQRLCCVKPAPKLIKRTAQRKMFVRRRCAMEERSPPARATRSPNITNIKKQKVLEMFVFTVRSPIRSARFSQLYRPIPAVQVPAKRSRLD